MIPESEQDEVDAGEVVAATEQDLMDADEAVVVTEQDEVDATEAVAAKSTPWTASQEAREQGTFQQQTVG